MKKFLAILLTAIMVMTFSVPAAVAAADETGSITINGISTESKTVYEVYKMMELESYDKVSGAYSYKADSEWSEFFGSAEAKAYVTTNETGYITWTTNEDDDTKAAFAKLALAYAKDKGITPKKSSKNEGEFVITTDPDTKKVSGKFSGLELGYYLVDSTVGALCGLTTTNPDASINAKNAVPTIDKQVQEDSTNQWADKNTADIGQTINFRTTINVHAGAENYVLHDKMSAGLTFSNSVVVKHIVPASGNTEGTTVDPKYYEVIENPGDECTFEVKFSKEFCDSLETNDKVIVTYSAMLNRNAVIAGEGNSNEAWLDYGEEHTTTPDITQTYTFGFDIIKTNSQNTLINGAKFRIYDAATGGNEVEVVLMDDGVTYRMARGDEEGVDIVVKDGKVRVVGFDNGTYYLEETEAPDGYNKLTARQKFIISDANLNATFNGDIYSSGSGVHVVNKTGTMLPETGGMGTTIFLLIGGILVVGAGVVLFARRRMSQYE